MSYVRLRSLEGPQLGRECVVSCSPVLARLLCVCRLVRGAHVCARVSSQCGHTHILCVTLVNVGTKHTSLCLCVSQHWAHSSLHVSVCARRHCLHAHWIARKHISHASAHVCLLVCVCVLDLWGVPARRPVCGYTSGPQHGCSSRGSLEPAPRTAASQGLSDKGLGGLG